MDDYTHFLVTYFLQHKNEAAEFIKEFIVASEFHHNAKVSKIRCDNGGEYSSYEFQAWSKEKGIILDYTIP